MSTVSAANAEAIEAWNGVLFDKFLRFREVATAGLGAHGDVALASHPPARGARALDIGCGFGDTSRQIAERVGPEGSVLGIDAAARFIETARDEARAAALDNVRFAVGDVQVETYDEAFDYAFSRFGTMFFANPVQAMRNVAAALRPGGQLCMVVWRNKHDNEWLHRAERVVEQFVEEPDDSDEPTCGPGPFSMAGADTVSDILKHSGFERIALLRNDMDIRIGGDIAEAVEFATALGPAGEVLRLAKERADSLRPQIEAALADALGDFVRPDGVWGPSSTWIVTAHVPG